MAILLPAPVHRQVLFKMFKVLAGMRPFNSSPVVTRLLEAHGVVLGKTHMEELAEGLTTINPVYGPVLNPYNNLHDVGGYLLGLTA